MEKARNEKLIEDMIDTPVTFGSEIQLMHADSKSFVCGSRTCTQNTKVGYECKLSQWYSKMMIFKILPKLKSRNEGEMIQYKDLVMFENMENISYLSFCFSKPVKFLQCDPTWAMKNPFRQIFNATNSDFSSFQCYLSMIPQTSFTCVLHGPSRRKDKTLYGQQFIRIAHTEVGGYLGADLIYPGQSQSRNTPITEQPQVYLGVDHSEHATEKRPGSTIWEIEMLKMCESGHAILLKDNPPLGEKLEDEEDEYDIEALDDSKYSVPVMIKHVCSNLRMESKPKIKDTMTDIDVDRGLPLLENYNNLNQNKQRIFEENSKFHFHLFPLVKLNKFAQVDQTYFLADSHFKFLKYNKNSTYKRAEIINGDKFKKSKYKQHMEPLEDKDISVIKYRTIFSHGISSKDTFLISRLKEHEVEDIMFVKSAVYHLNYLSEFFLRPQSSESRRLPSDREYLMVYKVLNKITQFVVEQETLTGRDSYEIEEGSPNQWRQHLIKDMGIIDLIMDIILFSMKNEFYNVEEINASSPFTPVLRSSYLALRKSIEEYRPNELYASQWLTVIIDQSLNFSGANGIEADKTLKELIDNNRTILMNRITDKVVQTCIESLKGKYERDDKYIGILRALCICNGTAIVQNQKLLIYEVVEKDSKDPSKALLIPFKMNEENDIEIFVSGSGEGRWEDLPTFVSNINRQNSGFYPYLISMITLLSDMCFDRNYRGIEVLQEIYPINLCLTILMDEACPMQMREVFGKLMSNLWINVSPFYKIQLPNPIKTYEGLSDKLTFTHFSGKRIIYDKVKEYIPRFIRTFTDKNRVEDPMEVRLVITLMEIML